jgi:hypothetical protein
MGVANRGWRRHLGAVATILASLAVAPRAAAQPPADSQAAAPVQKTPAPPLFPRHHRGLYRNLAGLEVIDATPQSPPLDTDDPGVPDQGAYEINFITHADYARQAQRLDLLLIDANYGVLPAIAGHTLPSQITIELPVAAARQAGEPFNTGIGAVAVGVKTNFYRDEQRGISASIYPQAEFAAPGGRGVEKGLAEKGATIIVPLLVAREFHMGTVVVNAGVEKPVRDPDRQLASEVGVAFGRALTRKVAAMIELRGEASADFRRDRLLSVNAGVIHGVHGIVYYFNLGHSLFADDGLSHGYAGIGLKLLIEPKHKAG